MKVLILHDELRPDARADELDALVQADAVSHALRELGHESQRLGCTLNLARTADAIRAARPDCVFNLVEAVAGQGRLIYLATALLESLGVPYTGAGNEAMFVTSSKTLCKQVLTAAGVPTPRWFTLDTLASHAGPVAGRYIVKSIWEEASVGIEDDSIVDIHDADDLRRELSSRFERLGGTAFAESYIDGREFNLALISQAEGVRVFPPAEIQFVGYAAGKPRIVGYSAKWREESHEYNNTPRTFDFPDADRGLLADLIRIAENCWRTLGLRGYARVDFRVDTDGRPWVLEVNANPCLSPDAGFMAAAGRCGLGMTDVVRRLLEDALEQIQLICSGQPGWKP